MRKKILLPLLLISTIIYSQDTRKLPKTDTDYAKYLNDGRKEMAKNAVKFHLDGLLNNDFFASYERKLASGLAIEVGSGIIPKYKAFFENEDINTFDSIRFPQRFGTSFHIMPKFYINNGGIDNGSYIGIMYKHRISNNFNGDMISYNELALLSGFQYLVKKSLCLDIGYGFGVATYKVAGVKDNNYITGKTEPFWIWFGTMHLRVGVGFYIGKNQYGNSKPMNKKTKKGEDEDEE